ncbi:unnamed protein product [Acanthoscelides obtectus]|uniref:Uncharacterized protein n=1 Tax=Acanthoscelides obtectus TaxID=200917 RepID=A0A9P0LFY3_ACAOB|nr:unnamed protein product [Acanthoscelides obtectus]CAK1621822.1 hypothetical protein AOBTE_LOCUS1150 [Acanthoscelides obtectus]
MIISIPMSRQMLVPLSERKKIFRSNRTNYKEKKLNITAGKGISILDLQNEPVAGPSGVKQNISNRNKKLEQQLLVIQKALLLCHFNRRESLMMALEVRLNSHKKIQAKAPHAKEGMK